MSYCLNIDDSKGLVIAKAKNKSIVVQECKPDDDAPLDTTKNNKIKIFSDYLKRTNKLKPSQLEHYIDTYKNNKTNDDLLYLKASDYVDNSLKKLMIFNDDNKVIPILPKRHWIIYCTGLSGSGKSYYLANLIKNNFDSSQIVYLFSPVEDDEAFAELNILQINLESFEDTFGIPFDISLLKGSDKNPSIAIFDDIHTFNNKSVRNLYLDVQKQILERGRHMNIRSINVSHNPMAGEMTKAPLRESEFYIVFPSTNYRDTKVLLNAYTGMAKDEVEEILNLNTRGVIIKKSVPSYYIADHIIRLLGK